MSERKVGSRAQPHAIVRRARPTIVGERPRRIVKRQAGGGVRLRDDGNGFSLPHPGARVLWPFAAALFVAAAVAGGFWLWNSPMFRVDTITVEGNERMDSATLVELANLQGSSMFTADLQGALENIRAHPLVSAAEIERSWPRTIHIRIAERQPWGTWEQQGVRYTIDREGVVLGTTIAAPDGAPVIRSSELGSRLQGEHVDIQAIQSAAEIYEELPRQLNAEVSEVAFLAGKGVRVTTTDGQTALFGDSSGIAYKIAAWAAIAKEAEKEHISYAAIDLRAGNRPVLIP